MKPSPVIGDLLDALEGMVIRHCTTAIDTQDSMSDEIAADAMRLLAKHGRMRIKADRGKRVVGSVIEP